MGDKSVETEKSHQSRLTETESANAHNETENSTTRVLQCYNEYQKGNRLGPGTDAAISSALVHFTADQLCQAIETAYQNNGKARPLEELLQSREAINVLIAEHEIGAASG